MSYLDIPGWFGFADVYDTMVAGCPDGGAIVEVGVAFGRSVAYLARKVIESRKQVTIWAVDPWKEDEWGVGPGAEQKRQAWGGNFSDLTDNRGGPFSAFIAFMTQCAPEELERINVCRCTSADAAQFVGPCFGVMIDGNHSFESVAYDIALWNPLATGILAGDDYSDNFPGVQRAVQEAFGNRGYIRKDGFDVRGTTWIRRNP
jgi:hypothetical protein